MADTGTSAEFYPDRRTAYVLGAGASKPYGFPLGGELKGVMSTLVLEDKVGFAQPLLDHCDQDPFTVQRALNERFAPTIDQCIFKLDPVHRLTARQIMCRTLAANEKVLREKALAEWGNWYPGFFDLIGLFKQDANIDIITFNYERSLDVFLERYAASESDWEEREAVIKRTDAVIKNIIRPHGWLGPLDQVPFGEVDNKVQIATAGTSVRIIRDDGLDASEEFAKAKKAIIDAEQIVFIGFAFEATTVGRLLNGVDRKLIWTTSYGLTEDQRKDIRALIPSGLCMPAPDKERKADALIEQLRKSNGKEPC